LRLQRHVVAPGDRVLVVDLPAAIRDGLAPVAAVALAEELRGGE
jgi:hypothetical protein